MASLILWTDVKLQAEDFSVPWHLKRGSLESRETVRAGFRSAVTTAILGVETDRAGYYCLYKLEVWESVPLGGGKQGFTLHTHVRAGHVRHSNSLSSSTAVSRRYLTATEFVCRIGAGIHIFNRAISPTVNGGCLLFWLRCTKTGNLLIFLYMQWDVP